MKKKQMLAMLLAALMTLSVPIVAFAEGEPTNPNTADLIQPYVVDVTAPILKSVTLSSETVNAGETLTVKIDAKDDITGVDEWQATFVNTKTKKQLCTYLQKYPDTGTLKTSAYEPTGTYELQSIVLEDKAGNSVWYEKNPGGWEPGDNAVIKKLELEVSFTVTNNHQVDTQAPDLQNVTVDRNNIKAGESVTVTIDAKDDITGVDEWQATFVNTKTKKQLCTYLQKYPDTGTLKTSAYEPTGTYELQSIVLEDKAGNSVWYEKNPGGWEPGDDAVIKKLELEVSFTVINDDSVPTPPAPEQKPFQPSYSTGSSASGSSVTSVKSAPAASGSSIKQEEKDRQFWKNKQDQIRKAANGKKIRIFIPKETTRVPASFLESIRTAENDITVELRWNGKKITITPETALKRSPRRVFWNLKTLLEYYHA